MLLGELEEKSVGLSSIRYYEKNFARYFGQRGAFSFWKGRVAFYAILKAMDIGSGDEVILPGYTCVMNVNPIKYVGAKPVYVDIEPVAYNIDVDLLEEKITPNTKAIIAQHTYGYMCNMDAIMDVANRHVVPVIEDSCMAFGSEYKGQKAGTFGKAAYFSFQWNKPYTTGLGGMVLTDDTQIAGRIEALCTHEMCNPSKKEVLMLAAQLAAYRTFIYPRTTALAQRLFRYLTKKGAVVGSSSNAEFEPSMPPGFFRGMSSVQARSGLRQLKRVERNITHRKKMAKLYDQLLDKKGWSPRDYDVSTMEPVLVRYPLRIAEKEEALSEAAKAGIELGSWFECPLHPMETPLGAYNYEMGMCPEAEKASREVINLPLHPRASEKTAKATVEFITRFTQVI
jgi:perosamine synthetase